MAFTLKVTILPSKVICPLLKRDFALSVTIHGHFLFGHSVLYFSWTERDTLKLFYNDVT